MRGVISCFALAAVSGLLVDAFAPTPATITSKYTLSRACCSSRGHGLLMSESTGTLQDTNVLLESSERHLQIPPFEPIEEQGRQWDIDTIVNNAFIFGAAALVLAKVALIDSDVSRGWTAAETIQHIPLGVWQSYMGVLTDAPVATKAVTSATVYTIGDVIAQSSEGSSIGEIDRMRTFRSMLAGLLGHGPLSHVWYTVSENLFEHLQWTEWWSFLPKIAVDQLFWGPFWNNTYIFLLGIMKFESFSSIWDDVKRTTIPLVVSGLKLWPLAHCVTYGLVPVENRLLWVDLVEIVWVTILATSAATAAAHHYLPEEEKVIQQEESTIISE